MKRKIKVSVKRTPKRESVKKIVLRHKSSAKRAVPSASGRTSKKIQLLDELKKISSVMIEEDLTTLIRNARILSHNREVLNSVGKRTAAGEGRKNYERNVQIEEAADLSYFLINFYNYQNFFSREEMRKIVKMCHASADKTAAAAQLFNWFKHERSDVTKNTGLDSAKDPILGILYDLVINKYSVKS